MALTVREWLCDLQWPSLVGSWLCRCCGSLADDVDFVADVVESWSWRGVEGGMRLLAESFCL